MFGKLNYSDAKVIVELGGGRGVFTHEILKLMSSDCKLLVFEVNEVFCNKLNSEIQDKRVTIINDSAEHIGTYLHQHKFQKADFIISSLPLSMFSLELKESILQNATSFLSEVGQFLQFQYAPFDYKRLKTHFGKVKMNFSLLNFPPAFVYRCSL
jgi:phospholipid N-methyltransferase